MAAAAPPQPIAQELHDETPTQDVDARVEDAEEHQADAAPWEKSFPPPESPWMPVRPQLEPLKDFCIAMPSLAVQEVDFFSLPPQLRMNLAFLKQIDPRDIVSNEAAAEMGPLLPPLSEQHKGRRTLVLDLDETLVHCQPMAVPGCAPAALQLRIETPASCQPPLEMHLYVRPFAQWVLELLARVFEVVVFTASAAIYADQVLNYLDPEGRYVLHRLYRQHCTDIGGALFKDLRRLGRQMEDVILVDNSPVCLGMNPDNGILCSSYLGNDDSDTELLDLLRVLEECQTHTSVQTYLIERYGLSAFLERLRSPMVPSPVMGMPGMGGPAPEQAPAPAVLVQAPVGPVSNVNG
eukprot:gnl/TRDRNA2_/TRDRNA2_131463_c0_seq1.p1 gnl/TRDRNA2_/TRDRNA2_131463_c0~~gnl/TRDRNA2_/TRDRNA2_131463_c0_seq1.p1  ORF type:complete len:351 (+),score=71.79 gnl/TRDRNA2_/TRDRNA2_131463_c0_seq1:164-1216(+)